MQKLRKPEKCPKCQASVILRIVGGVPCKEGLQMIKKQEAILGDCFIRAWKEDWHCKKCGYEWCDKTDHYRIEIEALAQKIIAKHV